MGNRIPAIWFIKKELHIASDINGIPNNAFNVPAPLDTWLNVSIVYSIKGSVNWYTVYVDGVMVKSLKNPSDKVYRDVKVYTTDPWHQPFSGQLRNLVISSEGKSPYPIYIYM